MRWMLVCLLATTTVSTAADELVRSVEQQRGGRHWIDQPTDPPKSAEDSAACFVLEEGYRITLAASEPLVFDPVGIDFDHRGRMFVAEYSDYPTGPAEPDSPALSRIVLLEDTDVKNGFDRRTVFADHLKFCHSVMAFGTGVLACTETQIVYLPDDNSDNVADRIEPWFDGFIPAHPQMQIGCPRRGLDNWIYFTYGHGKVRCVRPGFESTAAVDIPRVDFRFDPRTMRFEAVAGAGQFGNTIDAFGRRFFSSNRNPIMTDVFSLAQTGQNAFAGVSSGHTDVGPSGEKTRVYPAVTMKSNWLSHAGTHTSACGVTAYRGGLFGEHSDHLVFVCEPVGHLVTRSVIQSDGAGLTAVRGREQLDFLTSTDTWFRPASLATGPNGELYLADMYRLWVEHPKFVPEDVAQKMNWRAGEDRGRIWCITPDSHFNIPAPFISPQTDDELLQLLTDTNGWRRMLAQRLIVDAGRTDLEPRLRKLLLRSNTNSASTSAPLGRLHALWCLHGLQKLTPDDVITAAADEFHTIRRDAAKLIAELIAAHPSEVNPSELQQLLAKLAADQSPEVAFTALLRMPESAPNASSAVQAAAVSGDVWLQRALLLGAPQLAAVAADAVVSQATAKTTAPASGPAPAPPTTFLRQLAATAAARGGQAAVLPLAELIAGPDAAGQWWQTAIVAGLADGLPRGTDPALPKSLPALLAAPPTAAADSFRAISKVLETSAAIVTDRSRSDTDRLAAMELLPQLPPEQLLTAMTPLLSSGESPACQRAAVEALRRSGRPESTSLVLAAWPELSPAARSAALDLLLSRRESTLELLNQMQAGAIPASAASIDQRLNLLKHPEPALRALAEKLFGGTVSADRRAVAEQYAKALSVDGNASAGALVFQKTCSKCHRIGGVGANVGPDISDTRARARDALLYDILDPNRRVDPQFSEYVVVTTDGRLLNGLLAAENSESITLRQPEGREVTVPRTEIDELRTTSKSLMPEGIERDVTVEQMADILAFLKNR
ncbi:MAG: PVC-type heme-binding CxxCH protein [Planctomycetaceae bacterium]